MSDYGEEVILDLHGCEPGRFTRDTIEKFCVEMSAKLGMTPCDLHFWDDDESEPDEVQTDPKKSGHSAVQFWLESTLVIHTLDQLGKVFINAFTCKTGMDIEVVKRVAWRHFGGKVSQCIKLVRT